MFIHVRPFKLREALALLREDARTTMVRARLPKSLASSISMGRKAGPVNCDSTSPNCATLHIRPDSVQFTRRRILPLMSV